MTDRPIIPKVTILMPSLNVASYIRQSIESVVSQSLKDIEIICIDAGSTDGTLDIIEEYASADSRLTVIYSDRRSYGYQMNLGIEAAKGEYIGIVETDDYVDTNMYESLYMLASDTDSDMAKGTYSLVYEDEKGNICSLTGDYIPGYIREGQAFDPGNSPDVHSWERYIWNGIYRRSFLEEKNIRFNESEGAAFQDISFQQIILNDAKHITYIRKPYYNYRVVRPGASTWNGESIRYLYNEYKRIFDYKELKTERLGAIRSRMLWAFICEYEKELLRADYNRSEMRFLDETKWFLDQLERIYEESLFSRYLLTESYENRARRLIYDEENFMDAGKKGRKLLLDWLDGLHNIKGERPLILYGCGNYGNACMLFLIRNRMIPAGVVDQNEQRQGERFYGYEILSLETAVKEYPEAVYVTASKDSMDMNAELEKKGVGGNRVYAMNISGLYSAMCLIPYPLPEIV